MRKTRLESANFSLTPLEHQRGDISALDEKKSAQNLGQKRDSQLSTISYFSNGVVSRADLKFRLKAQKLKQQDAFRNTMKDLSQYMDLSVLGEKEVKSSTAAPRVTGDMTQDIFQDMRCVKTQ